jgi:hypothetical protein
MEYTIKQQDKFSSEEGRESRWFSCMGYLVQSNLRPDEYFRHHNKFKVLFASV